MSSRIGGLRHDRPEGDVEEPLRRLGRGRRHDPAPHVGAGVDVEAEPRVQGGVGEGHIGDAAVDMAHVVAPERSVLAAEEPRVPALHREQEPRALVAAGAEHDLAHRKPARTLPLEMEIERLDPAPG
jgi:hypothetical protein